MFGSKKSEIEHLRLRVASLVERLEAEQQLRQTAIRNQARMAERFAVQHNEVLRLRTELAGQRRVADWLSKQLMSSLGYTDAELEKLGLEVARMDGEETP
jgi:hypothetical protein